MIPLTFTAYQRIAELRPTKQELCRALGADRRRVGRALQSLIESGTVRRTSRPGVGHFVYEVAR